MNEHNNPNIMYPVAEITIGPVPAYQVILLRPDYLLPDQEPDQANYGRNYALTPKQARHLAQKLAEALHALDILASPNETGHKH